jgi:hypothetical protein
MRNSGLKIRIPVLEPISHDEDEDEDYQDEDDEDDEDDKDYQNNEV